MRMKALEVKRIEIAGAGPAGLTAALVAVAGGAEVTVHERRPDVGLRFHGDFQGLENWTTEHDVLDELARLGIQPTFDYLPVREQVCYDADGKEHVFRSREPFYYLVRRGPGIGTLDHALKEQALAAGVTLRFNDPVDRLPRGGIVAHGPRAVHAIAAGYLFETDAANGAFAAVNNRVTPGGYGYLLIHNGRATLASCMFRDFHNERAYVERTLEFFQGRLRFTMRDPRRFGGYGALWSGNPVRRGWMLYAGEAAGFQDALWGFGLRYAIHSGALAARALSNDDPRTYDSLVAERLAGLARASIINRCLFARLGDRGAGLLMQRMERAKYPRAWLRRGYGPSAWKTALSSLAAQMAGLADAGLPVPEDCDCTWCRCTRHGRPYGDGTDAGVQHPVS